MHQGSPLPPHDQERCVEVHRGVEASGRNDGRVCIEAKARGSGTLLGLLLCRKGGRYLGEGQDGGKVRTRQVNHEHNCKKK